MIEVGSWAPQAVEKLSKELKAVTGQNRYGEKTSYAVYALVGSEGK